MRVKLASVHANRYGEGKVHILTKESAYVYTRCGRVPYIKMIWWGDFRDATCKRCYPNAKDEETTDREYASV